jgi:hypothetical protein
MNVRSIATQPARAGRVKPLGHAATASSPLENSWVRRRRRQCVLYAVTEREAEYLLEAASLAMGPVTLTEPHPNSACLLVSESNEVFRGVLWAQGCESAEVQAVRRSGRQGDGWDRLS